MVSYDVCVVGAGMIGSAAAKYCQLLINKDQSVVLIGPEEPKKQVRLHCQKLHMQRTEAQCCTLSSLLLVLAKNQQ